MKVLLDKENFIAVVKQYNLKCSDLDWENLFSLLASDIDCVHDKVLDAEGNCPDCGEHRCSNLSHRRFKISCAAHQRTFGHPTLEEKVRNKLSDRRNKLRSIEPYLESARESFESKKPAYGSPEFKLLVAVESILSYLKSDLNKELIACDMQKV